MAVAEELQIIIDAKVNGAIADLKKVRGQTDGLTKSSKSMGAMLKKVAGPIMLGAVIAGTIKMGLAFEKASSDAKEIKSKFATIFRDMGTEAETMADDFADAFGLAGSTSRDLLGNTADLLTGLGFTQQGAADLSLQVNTLAGDLASFSNFEGGAAGASMALTKALLGEAESAKALGIVINQNTKEYKDSVKYYTEIEGKTLLQAKAFTALKFSVEQSGNAIGDVSRTWDSAANVSKRLKEQTKGLEEAIGDSLSPTVTAIKSTLGEWAEAITDVLNETRNLKDAELAAFNNTETNAQAILLLETQIAKEKSRLSGEAAKELEKRQRQEREFAAERATLSMEQKATDVSIFEAEKEATALNISQLERQLTYQIELRTAEEARLKVISDLAAAKAASDLADSKAADLKKAELDFLASYYKKTHEGQVEALEASIKEFESYKQVGDVLIVLRDLRIELAELTKKEIIDDTTLLDNAMKLAAYRAETSQVYVESLDTESEAIEKLTLDYKALAEDGMGAFASAFQMVGQEGVTGFDVMKQAGKDAISALLKGLAEYALAQAALALVPGVLTFNPAAAIGYTAAAAGAYAASGAVQNLATGGSFVANQATPIMVGEGGGSERVTVEPIGGGSSGGGSMILNIDGTQFTGWIQDKLDNGNIRLPRRAIV